MIRYEKPIISVDAGMAEGIYAASGATESAVTLSGLTVINNWGNSGQLKFTADFSKLSNRSNLTLTVTFNTTVTNAWGGSSHGSTSDNTATFTWSGYEAPVSADDFTIQVSVDPNTVAITGYTYTQA